MCNRDREYRHTADEERLIRESALDETIANTFPASDPPSSIPNPADVSAIGAAAPGREDKGRAERSENVEPSPRT